MSAERQNITEPEEPQTTVLVVDDDSTLRRQLRWALDEGRRVLEAGTRHEAVELLRAGHVDVVICDLRLPPLLDSIDEGLAVVEAARGERPPVPVIIITGSDDRQDALEAISRGAYGFFRKPFDGAEVSHIVTQAARVRRLECEVLRLRSELEMFRGFGRFVGTSPALECVLKQARAVADTSATVLITGENGTGKEVLARAIHEESPRRERPFIAVSCAALPETLIESELFGHERGAFTGAVGARKGRFELADGGTLFLDEVGELSPAVQVKLLRVLQERSFERLGGAKPVSVDIRLIAASNRDLEQDVERGVFRRDLFFRLNVIPLHLPSLRERREDIPVLAAHFAAKAAEKHGRATSELDPALIEALTHYNWPGNVRELENLVERLVVLTREPPLGVEFLPEKMLRTPQPVENQSPASGDAVELSAEAASFEGAMHAHKRQIIADALRASGGNRVAAARSLGISRSYLHRLIAELNLK